MKFHDTIPQKINFSNCNIIFLKFNDSLYWRCKYNTDVISSLRNNENIVFGVSNYKFTKAKELVEKNIKTSIRGLPKQDRDAIRPEIDKFLNVFKKFNQNIYYAPSSEINNIIDSIKIYYDSALYIDYNENYVKLYEYVHNEKPEKIDENNLQDEKALEKNKKFKERLQNLKSFPENLPIVDPEIHNKKIRVNDHFKVKAIFGDGVYEKLKELGWEYAGGFLETHNKTAFIEALQWLDYNNYKDYAIDINTFESIGDYVEEQKIVIEKNKELQELQENTELQKQEKINEAIKDLRHNTDIPIFYQDNPYKINNGEIYLDDEEKFSIKAHFNDGVYESLKSIGWSYSGSSTLKTDNDKKIYDGLAYINNYKADEYRITINAIQRFQGVYENVESIIEKEKENITKSKSVQTDKDFPKPDTMEYLDYQKAGINYAYNKKSSIIADEMGLGKTIQAIGCINTSPEIKNILVICPASLKHNWKKESEKWLTKNLSIGIAEGSHFPESNIVIINYDILDRHKNTIQNKNWDTLILDEFQYLKSSKAKRTHLVYGYPFGGKQIKNIQGAHALIIDTLNRMNSFYRNNNINYEENEKIINDFKSQLQDFANNKERTPKLCSLYNDIYNYFKNSDYKTPAIINKYLYRTPIFAKQKIGLSGTPFENRPIEAWNTLHYFDPDNFDDFFSYAKKYCGARHNGYGWDFSGASNLKELQNNLRKNLMIRRLKKDVMKELPEKQRQIIELSKSGIKGTLNKIEKKYDEHNENYAYHKAQAEIARINGSQKEYFEAIEKIKTDQKVFFEEISHLRKEIAQKKLPYIIEHIYNTIDNGNKVVCFAHHNEIVEELREEFGDKAVVVYGKNSNKAKRHDSVERFQNDPDCQIFIGSIRSAGVGLTLTASSTAIFAELDYNPLMLLQAEDRIHRIGQKNSALIQYLVFENSIDSKMLSTIIEKMKNFDQAFDSPTPEIEEKPNLDTENTPKIAQNKTNERNQNIDQVMGENGKYEDFYVSDERVGGAQSTSQGQLPFVEPDEDITSVFNQPATVNITKSSLKMDAEKLNKDDIHLIHNAITEIAIFCDGAKEKDDMGFNSTDAYVGNYLSKLSELNSRQAIAGLEIVKKYKRQIDPDTYNELRTILNDLEYTSYDSPK